MVIFWPWMVATVGFLGDKTALTWRSRYGFIHMHSFYYLTHTEVQNFTMSQREHWNSQIQIYLLTKYQTEQPIPLKHRLQAHSKFENRAIETSRATTFSASQCNSQYRMLHKLNSWIRDWGSLRTPSVIIYITPAPPWWLCVIVISLERPSFQACYLKMAIVTRFCYCWYTCGSMDWLRRATWE